MSKPIPKLEATVKGLGNVYEVTAPFHKALKSLNGKRVLSGRDLALARWWEKGDSSMAQEGSYISEGIIYCPRRDLILLVRDSPVMQSPKKATRAHEDEEEFYLSKKKLRNYLERLENQESSVLALEDLNPIQTKNFGEDKRTKWLFRDQAEPYGKFLDFYGIEKMPFIIDCSSYVKDHNKPYANQLYLSGISIEESSELDCSGIKLDFENSVRATSFD